MDLVATPVGDPAEAALRDAWVTYVAEPTELFDELVARHREEHRQYHGLDHVAHVVETVHDLAASLALSFDEHADAIAGAFYHDAIYEPRSSTNEQESALLARRDLSTIGWPADRIESITAMIEGTASHTDPATTATELLYDADLAILGSTPDRYEAYRSGVRAEYGHVTDEQWRIGRPDVLRSFLGRPRIYATAPGHDRWEAAARRNLVAEIESLTV